MRRNRTAQKTDRLQDLLLEATRKWATATREGRVKDEAPAEQIEALMRRIAEELGVYGEVDEMLKEAHAATKGASEPAGDGAPADPQAAAEEAAAPEPGLEEGEDIDLTEYPPVVLTRSEREEINEQAINLLQRQRQELTAEDVNILRQYTGRGGLEAETDEEGIRSLNEHYTAYGLIEAIWSALGAAGFDSGPVLEPGSGIGNFSGFAPEDVTMLMVERSNLSARIAELLYPSHEVVNDSLTQVTWDRYNVSGAVGNVPFGAYQIAPSDSPFSGTQIHDYFILKAIEEASPGAPIALITSTGTMDKASPRARRMMMKRAHFVDAVRLPSTMFRENADTLVTTDLIIFQAREGQITEEEFGRRERDFVDAVRKTVGEGEQEQETALARHFDENDEKILGRLEAGLNSQFLTQWGVDGDKEEAIAAVEDLDLDFPIGFPEGQLLHAFDEEEGVKDIETEREYPYGAIANIQGEFREKQNVAWKEISNQVPAADEERLKSALSLLDRYADYISEKSKNPEAADAGAVREAIDLHVEQYGLPAEDEKIKQVLRYDPRLPKLKIMVEEDENGDLEYADVLLSDRVYSERYREEISDTEDFAEITTYLRGQGEPLTPESYAQVYQGGTATEEDVIEAQEESEDFFYDPQKERQVYRYDYLSGNLYEKIDAAEAAGLQRNVKALEEALPPQSDIFEIELDPRHVSSYLSTSILQAWVESEIGARKGKVEVVASSETVGDNTLQVFRCEGPRDRSDENAGWGTQTYSQIVDIYLKGKQFPRTVVDEDGNPKGKPLKEASAKEIKLANQYQEAWQQRMEREIPRDFQSWVRDPNGASTETREQIQRAYNREFNSISTPTFDGSTFSVRGITDVFNGMEGFDIFDHNEVVAEKLLWNLGGGDFHDVGSGKTLASLITMMAAQQRGAWKKTIIAVPGQVLRKWQAEFSELFPNATSLVVELQSGNRAEELARAQAGDWNAILMPLSAFKRLPLSKLERKKRLRQRIDEVNAMLNAELKRLKEQGASKQQINRLKKKYQKLKAEYEEKIEDLGDIEEEEVDVYFDEMGADSLIIDEAHAYKNALGTPLARQLGIAGSTSDRAEAALRKARWVHSQHPDGISGVVCLTATPVQNSPIEVWHQLNLCAPHVLEEFGIKNLDTFINLFVERGTETSKQITGSYDREEAILGYKNLGEMRRIIDQACDIKSYEQLQRFYAENPDMAANFSRPPHDVGHEMIEAQEIQELLFDDLEIREEIVIQSYKDKQPGEDRPIRDNPLVVTNDGSRIANDVRIFKDDFGGVDSRLDGLRQKIDALVENVVAYYEGEKGATMDSGDEGMPEDARDVGGTDTPDDIEDAETIQAGAEEESLADTFFPITDLEEVEARPGHYATVETDDGTAVVADTRTFTVIEETSFSQLFFEEKGMSGDLEQADLRGGIRSFKERGEDIIRIQRLSLDTTRLDTQTGLVWRTRLESNLDVTAEDLMEVMRDHGLVKEVGADVTAGLDDFDQPKTKFGSDGGADEYPREDLTPAERQMLSMASSPAARSNPDTEVAIGEINRSAWGVGTPLRDKERENPPPRNQIVFTDQISLDAGETGSFFDLIKSRLVEEGIPADEIVILTGSKMTLPDGSGGFTERSPDDKQQAKLEIQKRFNEGTHQVLLANSTAEEGMNLDQYGVATHHLDVPYRPTRLQQRNGRMVRQGNEYGSVDVLFYLLEGSFDEYRLQLVQSKQGWIDELFYGSDRKAESQDTSKSLSYEEMQAATAEDQAVSKFFEAKQAVKDLENRESALESEAAELQSAVVSAESDIERSEERVQNTLETEEQIQAQGFPYRSPEAALESGDLSISIEEQQFGDDVEIEIEVDMTEPRSFGTGYNENMTLDINVPSQNPNARVSWTISKGMVSRNVDVTKRDLKSRENYNPLRGAALAQQTPHRMLWNRIKRKSEQIFERATDRGILTEEDLAESPSLQSLARVVQHGDFGTGTTPSESQRLASQGFLIGWHGDVYRQEGIDDPDEDRGDRTFSEYKQDLGMEDVETWRPIARRRIAAWIWTLELDWYLRSEEREESARQEIEDARSRLETAESQLEDVQGTLEQVRVDLKDNRQTVRDLRDRVNEVQTRAYDTRPEIYRRINEIREDYGIENEISMRVVTGDADDPVAEREAYLEYMANARAARQRTFSDVGGEEEAESSTPDVEVEGASVESEIKAPLAANQDELAVVHEAQTGRELPEGQDALQDAVFDLNVLVGTDSQLANRVVTGEDIQSFIEGYPTRGLGRLASTDEDIWTDDAMAVFGGAARRARSEMDDLSNLSGYKPYDASRILDGTANAADTNLKPIYGAGDKDAGYLLVEAEETVRRATSRTVRVDAKRLAFCLFMADYDFTDLGDSVQASVRGGNADLPGAILGIYLRDDGGTFGYVGEIKNNETTIPEPISELRDNPTAGTNENKADPGWVFLGFAGDLEFPDREDVTGQRFMFAPAEERDALLLVPPGHVQMEGHDPEEGQAMETFEEWHDYPPRGAVMHFDQAEPPYETLPAPKRIHYISDKIMRDGDEQGKVHRYYHDFTTDHSVVMDGRGAIAIGYETDGPNLKPTGSVELDGRGLIN